MAEYIERWPVVNRLIDIENEFQQYKPFHGFEHAMYRKICEVEIAIGKTPDADVAPVRHGRWEEKAIPRSDPDGDWIASEYYCSLCNRLEYRKENYCPNCGARMDLEES